MNTYKVTVYITAYNKQDLIERLEDTDNPIDDYETNSIQIQPEDEEEP